MRRWLLLVVPALVLLGACSGSSDDDASSAGGLDGAEAVADEGAGGGVDSDGGAVAAVPVGAPLTAGRSIISTASATVSVEDVEVAARRAIDLAVASGGFLAGQEARLEDREVRVTLRVPSPAFHQVLGDVSDLGTLAEADVHTQDVTEQVIDLEGRVGSARTSIERLRGLLDRAGDVAQLATVEGELARREAELESLLGRLRVLEDQVDLSTLDVQFTEEPAADDDLPGFLDALATGWGAFLTVASAGLVAVAFTLPFAVLALVAVLVVAAARRRPAPARSHADH